jgi:GNAT superfamily N-acetyltransferase
MGIIRKVSSKKDLKKFINMHFNIYGKIYRNWVPPLNMDMKERLDKKLYPFFEYSDSEFFIYEEDGEVLGRITASVNHRYNQHFNTKTGFFGFYESVDRQYVSDALFDAACNWLKEKGMDEIMGPFNFSTNEEGGLLIKGFDRPPMILMTYNPEYYVRLFEKSGLQKTKEWWAWYVDKWNINISDRMVKFIEKVESKTDVVFRTINMKKFREDVEKIKEIYNEAWIDNWGFVPYTDAEIDKLAKDLKMVVDPDLILFAEVNGEPAGFIIGFRDINEILIDLKGKLFPFGLFKLLFGMKKIKHMRVVTLGVKHKFRRRGFDVTLYYKIIENARKKGILGSEMSWILDDNYPMNNILKNLNADKYKIYGIYGKKL